MLSPGKLSSHGDQGEKGGWGIPESGGFAVDTYLYPSSASQRSSMKLPIGKDTIQEEPVPNAVVNKWLRLEVTKWGRTCLVEWIY